MSRSATVVIPPIDTDAPRFDGYDVFQAKVVNVLHKRQQRLRCMRLIGTDVPDEVVRWRTTGVSNITTIFLRISSRACAQAWDSAFEKLPHLRNLELVLNTLGYQHHLRRKTEKLLGSADIGFEAVITLFGTHTTNSSKRLGLQSLQVMGLDLTTAAQPLYQAIDHTQLSALGLQHCKNPTAMLHALDTKTRVGELKLRSLVIVGVFSQITTERSNLLNDVLGSFSTLEYLIVDVRPNLLWLDFERLLPHASTLRFLYLDVAEPTGPVPKEERIKRISATKILFSKCTKLEQLAIRCAVWAQDDVDCCPDAEDQRFQAGLHNKCNSISC